MSLDAIDSYKYQQMLTECDWNAKCTNCKNVLSDVFLLVLNVSFHDNVALTNYDDAIIK